MSSNSAATSVLLIRSMIVVVSQHVLQRLLFLRIHRQQLRAQVGVLPALFDGGLAVGQLLHAGVARLRVPRGRFERELVAFEKDIVELFTGDGHDFAAFFHCSWSCFFVEKRIHFELPSLMSRMPAISAWLRPSISKSEKTVRRCSGNSFSNFRNAIRFTSSTALAGRTSPTSSSIGVSRILRLRFRNMS